MRLPASTELQLRFFGNYPAYAEYLIKLDADRFRGLGDAHTVSFVQRATTFASRVALNYREDVEYVIFLMYFLGSNFYEDPRYKFIAEPFFDKNANGTERVRMAHELFIRFSVRFIGEDLQVFKNAFQSFHFQSERISANRGIPEDYLEALFISYQFTDAERRIFPARTMLDNAVSDAQILGLASGNESFGLCLCLAFWLGAGFGRDPLFPWVRDIIAGIDDPTARTRALKNYATKRQEKMIRTSN